MAGKRTKHIPLTGVLTEIAASGEALSNVIDLSAEGILGYFTMTLDSTGSGTLEITALYSPTSDGTFLEVEGADPIVSLLSSGEKRLEFDLAPFDFVQFKFAEDGGASTIEPTEADLYYR